MLRVSGQTFDADGYAKKSNLTIEAIHHRGDRRGDGTPHEDSYVGILVSSRSGDDLQGQVEDCVRFLRQNRSELQLLVAGAEDARLDFSRLFNPENDAAQFSYFTPDLVQLAGVLGMGIELSTYAVEGDSEP